MGITMCRRLIRLGRPKGTTGEWGSHAFKNVGVSELEGQECVY